LTADLDLGEAKGKAEAVRRLAPLLIEMGDRVQRAHYVQLLSRMVQVDEGTLWLQVRQAAGGKRPAPRRAAPQAIAQAEEKVALDLDEHCLSLVLHDPGLLEHVDEALVACEEDPFQGQDLARVEDRAILDAWRQWLAGGGTPDARAEFYDSLDERLQERVKRLTETRQDRPPTPEDMLPNDVLDAVTRLRLRNLRREIHELRFLLDDPEDGEAAAIYGPQIRRSTVRIRRLQQAMNARSISGRRQREDAAVRVPFGEE
jgi:DNA primase